MFIDEEPIEGQEQLNKEDEVLLLLSLVYGLTIITPLIMLWC